MSSQTPQLGARPVSQLFQSDQRYFIPSYQRGYRWRSTEVEQLLEDVSNFEPSPEAAKYSLQPVVVHKDGKDSNKWVVIDGQQRLTTIYLILKALGGDDLPNGCPIEYETRAKSREFLNDIDASRKDENIDFYHFAEAYETIKGWLNEHQSNKDELRKKLLDLSQVIWYEIPVGGDQDPKQVFMRFNQGKIELDQAELIKALFLKSDAQDDATSNTEARRDEIAHQWNEIECTLRGDAFWYFLMGTKANEKAIESKYKNRILLLLEMQTEEKRKDDQETFDAFAAKDYEALDESWNQIWHSFQILQGWYHDRTIYHLIGFLRSRRTVRKDDSKNEIKKRIEAYKKVRKSEYVSQLKPEVKDWIEKESDDVEPPEDINSEEDGEPDPIAMVVKGANYEDDKKLCADILLLYNIALTEKHQDHDRFPFEKYLKLKSSDWSLEHIHPQKPRNENADTPPWIHRLGNLTLIQLSQNQKLSNKDFQEKREQIIDFTSNQEGDKEDGSNSSKHTSFIPIGTHRVFQKDFSRGNDNLEEWNEDDVEAYQNDIIKTLKFYLNS